MKGRISNCQIIRNQISKVLNQSIRGLHDKPYIITQRLIKGLYLSTIPYFYSCIAFSAMIFTSEPNINILTLFQLPKKSIASTLFKIFRNLLIEQKKAEKLINTELYRTHYRTSNKFVKVHFYSHSKEA